jgi:hypothetical protein
VTTVRTPHRQLGATRGNGGDSELVLLVASEGGAAVAVAAEHA